MPIDDRLAPETIERTGRFDLSARILPRLGGNWVSFRIDGEEWLKCDPATLELPEPFTGAFNLFPTPCRLAGGRYTFEGREIVQRKHGRERAIHGLVYDEVMTYDRDETSITCRTEVGPDHPVFEGFPFRFAFSVTHALHDSGLTLSFSVRNNDTCNIPFGYGVHPYWRIQGERSGVSVRVPCDYTLDLDNLVPTGDVTPVAGTELDLRELKSIDGFFIDNAFWKREPGASAELHQRAAGKKLTFEASDNFPHMIVYAPEGQSFLCVENLTTCPNAPNLATQGQGDVANMLIARPGETVEGWIRYTLEEI